MLKTGSQNARVGLLHVRFAAGILLCFSSVLACSDDDPKAGGDAGEHDAGPDSGGGGSNECSGGTFDNDGDPSTECKAWTVCKPGQYVAEDGTPLIDRKCRPCGDGMFSARENAESCTDWTRCDAGKHIQEQGGSDKDQTCEACADGFFSDGSDSGKCEAWTTCSAGQYMVSGGSGTKDRECAACPSGTWSDSENVDSCKTWSTCEAGSFVNNGLPNSSKDRVCEKCGSGTYTKGPNRSECLPDNVCAAGTHQTAAGSGSMPPTCEDCKAGQYCAGGLSAQMDCADGTWDNDNDPGTECIPRTVCLAGQGASDDGSATKDRVCTGCGNGTYSDGSGKCEPWTVCEPGTKVKTTPRQNRNRECIDCEDGTFTKKMNADVCKVWSQCQPGTFKGDEGTSKTDRTCDDCAPGFYSDEPDATECKEWSTCAKGSYYSNEPSTSEDRNCEVCKSGTFTDAENQPVCVTDDCPKGQVQVMPKSGATASVCMACSAGSYCAGGTETKKDCQGDYYDHDSDPKTACELQPVCNSGQHVVIAATPTVKRTCTPCEAMKYSVGLNKMSCDDWTTCAAGKYADPLADPPSPTKNRTCTLCGEKTWKKDAGNATMCDPKKDCDKGTRISDEGNEKTDRTCMTCADGTFTDDKNKTECTSYMTCGAGSHVTAGTGSTMMDRTCTPCEDNTFLATADQTKTACTTKKTCKPGESVMSDGSRTADRSCKKCDSGTFSVKDNAPSCNTVTTCATGTELIAADDTARDHDAVCGADQRLASGDAHTCVVRDNTATINCWGYNSQGQSDPSTKGSNVTTPRTIMGLAEGAVAVAAGTEHSCALIGTSKKVYCWGLNTSGQLGTGNTNPQPTVAPVEVANLSNAVAITAGSRHTCALTDQKKVVCWGFNGNGELGNAMTSSSDPTLVEVATLTDVTALAASVDQTCAIKNNDTIWCWGRNLGAPLIGSGANSSSTPLQVPGITQATALQIGAYHGCARTLNGAVWCWGGNGYKQLGRDTSTTEPAIVAGVADVKLMGTGGGQFHNCVKTTDNTVMCWGQGATGQLGNGVTDDTATPVVLPANAGLGSATAITAGYWHTCARIPRNPPSNPGTVRCWGLNNLGQLGIGSEDGSVGLPTDVTAF